MDLEVKPEEQLGWESSDLRGQFKQG
jgi:hypothetical protein